MKYSNSTRKMARRSAVAIFSLFIFFVLVTDPQSLAATWLIVPFMLLFGSIAISYVVWRLHFTTQDVGGMGIVSSAMIVAGFPTVFMLLLSLGQLGAKDVMLLMVLAVITLFYSRRILRLSRRV